MADPKDEPIDEPVTIDLVCPKHGQPKRVIGVSLQAQQEWTEFFQQIHTEALGCTLPLTVLVVLPDGCVDGHSPDLVTCELGVDWP